MFIEMHLFFCIFVWIASSNTRTPLDSWNGEPRLSAIVIWPRNVYWIIISFLCFIYLYYFAGLDFSFNVKTTLHLSLALLMLIGDNRVEIPTRKVLVIEITCYYATTFDLKHNFIFFKRIIFILFQWDGVKRSNLSGSI